MVAGGKECCGLPQGKLHSPARAVRFAVANNVIEGGYVLPETEAALDEWVHGEIDDDELMEQTLKRFGPGV
jgi:hypothetical protein